MYQNGNDLFFQVKEPCSGEYKTKGSRFLTTIRKVETQEEAQAVLEEVARQYHDATHHCFAWKVGLGKKMKYKYSDGGEPNNTAGLPIFKAIEARRLTNVVIVVTRYFGGVKLGTGGLFRAYSKATNDVLDNCEIGKYYQTELLVFKVGFEFVAVVHNIITSFKANLKNTEFGDRVQFSVEIKNSKFRDFEKKLKDGTNGQIEFIR